MIPSTSFTPSLHPPIKVLVVISDTNTTRGFRQCSPLSVFANWHQHFQLFKYICFHQKVCLHELRIHFIFYFHLLFDPHPSHPQCRPSKACLQSLIEAMTAGQISAGLQFNFSAPQLSVIVPTVISWRQLSPIRPSTHPNPI